MFPKLTPRNTHWNRRFQFTDDEAICFLIEIKNGLAYFAHIPKEADAIFYKCEVPFSKSNLIHCQKQNMNLTLMKTLPGKRYPGGL
ncbi:MAG: hypothetical protein IPP29_16820 [Bacteroidetes bacterium]|nr:hypothetical protein [Bacteroidota bacterium]